MTTLKIKQIYDIDDIPFKEDVVYVIEFTNLLSKIGMSCKPKGRIRSILNSNPYNWKSIVLINGVKPITHLEKLLHRKFKSYRVKGEFFNLPFEEILSVIKNLNVKECLPQTKKHLRSVTTCDSVIQIAFKGIVEEIAKDLHISDKRIYEIIKNDNPYTKCWRLLDSLGRVAPNQLLLVQSDFNARCNKITQNIESNTSVASIHQRSSSVINNLLNNTSKLEQQQEILRLISELYQFLALLNEPLFREEKQLERCDQEI